MVVQKEPTDPRKGILVSTCEEKGWYSVLRQKSQQFLTPEVKESDADSLVLWIGSGVAETAEVSCEDSFRLGFCRVL